MSFDPDHLARVVAEAVNASMDARSRINEESHREHHDWVREQIAKQRARNEFWTGLAQKSLPVIGWSLIVAAAGGLWRLVSAHINWN